MTFQERIIEEVKEKVAYEKKIVKELFHFFNQAANAKGEEKTLLTSQIESLKNYLRDVNIETSQIIKGLYLAKPLGDKYVSEIKVPEQKGISPPMRAIEKMIPHRGKSGKLIKELQPKGLEKETLKRLKKTEIVVVKEKENKPNQYAKISNSFFSKTSMELLKKKKFQTLETDLTKANLQFTAATYISIIFFTTLLSFIAAVFIFLFFMFFNFVATLPIITRADENLLTRLPKVVWILVLLPLGTYLMMYLYPSLERKSAETNIDYELPFATINMAAISGSLIDPTKIFKIIILTKEYPALSKEFTKIINAINIEGYNFVSALRNAAFNSPSKKLSELLSGLATTINSGGDLPDFFEERSKSLLFEHRLEREKQGKAAETFMDIYISVVIAAPMILMLLLMMMKISGLGISLSTSTITIIMVLGVTVINVVFLTFLHLKKSE